MFLRRIIRHDNNGGGSAPDRGKLKEGLGKGARRGMGDSTFEAGSGGGLTTRYFRSSRFFTNHACLVSGNMHV